MALSAGLRIGQSDLPSCATVPLKSYPVTQPDNSRIVRFRNRKTKALSGYTTGQLKHCLVAQRDNSSATRLLNRTTPRYPVTQPDNSSVTRLRNGTVPLCNRFPRGCALGRLICPVVQSCHSRAIPGYTTGQLQCYPVAQPDNSSATRLRNRTTSATRLRNRTVPLRNRMALSAGLRSGLPGCATGQFKYCLVTQPDN